MKRIKDILHSITGLELKNSANEGYFAVDIDDDLTYKITRDELIDFIIKRGTAQNIIGTSVFKDTGNDSDEIPYFITNSTVAGIVKHVSLGGLITVSENTAFNRNFSNEGGTNGTSTNVAREDHTHSELASISLIDNEHSATFFINGQSSYTITEAMLLSKMKYTPTKKINPAVVYRLWIFDAGTLTPVASGSVSETITATVYDSDLSGSYYKFSSLNLSSLNNTRKYVIKVDWIDDNGIYLPTSSGQ